MAWHPEYKTSIGDFSVPILFYHPGNPELKGMDSFVVQQMDIMPSILHYLNFDGSYRVSGAVDAQIAAASGLDVFAGALNARHVDSDLVFEMNGKWY